MWCVHATSTCGLRMCIVDGKGVRMIHESCRTPLDMPSMSSLGLLEVKIKNFIYLIPWELQSYHIYLKQFLPHELAAKICGIYCHHGFVNAINVKILIIILRILLLDVKFFACRTQVPYKLRGYACSIFVNNIFLSIIIITSIWCPCIHFLINSYVK